MLLAHLGFLVCDMLFRRQPTFVSRHSGELYWPLQQNTWYFDHFNQHQYPTCKLCSDKYSQISLQSHLIQHHSLYNDNNTCWELFHLIPFPYNAYWLQQQQLGCSNTKLWNQWCMLLWTVLTVFVLLEGHRRCSNVHWLIRILCLLCCYLRGSFAPHPLTPSVFFQDSITLYPPAHHTRLPRIHVVDIASLAWGLSLPTWGVRQYRTTFLDLWVAEGEV